jgi:serine/threonine protein kinase
MNRICLKCNVISQDFNLWCQEKHCPAENATEIFNNGEWFGIFEIVQPLVILRSAIVYQARRENEVVFLKIANAGCEEKLRQEAIAFYQLAKAGQHPLLPVLLPAHPQSTIAQHPYGWTVILGQIKYYAVFKFFEGEVLRNYLFKNPQPWFQHVGWIGISISDVIIYLHRAGKIHLCLNPDIVFLRFDKQGIPRPLLLDLGVGDLTNNIPQIWNDQYNLPAYTAPEILSPSGNVAQTADVYGIGLLLYEMLTGRPAYEYHLKKDETVFRNVKSGAVKPSGRIDLKEIPEIVEKAISVHPQSRYADVQTLVSALKPYFPPIPAEKKSRGVNWRLVFIVLAALLAVSLILMFAVSILPEG